MENPGFSVHKKSGFKWLQFRPPNLPERSGRLKDCNDSCGNKASPGTGLEKEIMGDNVLTTVFSKIADKGFAGKLGIKVISLTPGHAILEMTPGKDDVNLFGTVHGGVIFSLIDEAFQMSCNSHGIIALALSVNVVYHNPGRKGRKLRAESREIHRSQKIATYDINIKDEKDVLIASCQAVAYRKKEQVPFLSGGLGPVDKRRENQYLGQKIP